MFELRHKGDFSKTLSFLERSKTIDWVALLTPYAEQGLKALRDATPSRSGITAASWSYEIIKTKFGASIVWTNDHFGNGLSVPLVILMNFGHATGTGGFVLGRNFIEPTIQPVFDEIAKNAWKEVKRL